MDAWLSFGYGTGTRGAENHEILEINVKNSMYMYQHYINVLFNNMLNIVKIELQGT